MPDFCNINAAQFAVGQVATPETLSAIRDAAGVQKHRLERPEDMFNLLPKPDRIRVLVNARDEIIELICG
ncbi:I78 family peptidase inhibitor [Pseudomonas sp. P2757]|uniref:I78 family peptidase inhibitor n=1 Tax=unclassified Pseudomonas TaxID=196821 RepID=UPI003B5B5EFA